MQREDFFAWRSARAKMRSFYFDIPTPAADQRSDSSADLQRWIGESCAQASLSCKLLRATPHLHEDLLENFLGGLDVTTRV